MLQYLLPLNIESTLVATMGTSEITADSIASEIPAAVDTNVLQSWSIASKFVSRLF